MLLSLLNKSFIYWRRNWIASTLEAILPLLIVSVSAITFTLVDQYPIERQAYMPRTILSFGNMQETDLNRLLFYKNCDKGNKRGGRVVFSPENEMTRELAQVLNALNYTTTFMESQDKINEFLADPDYILPFANGTRRQFCFGVVFNSSVASPQYDYSLLFNNSNIRNPEFRKFEDLPKVSSTEDSNDDFQKMLKNGIVAAKILVDSAILRRELGQEVEISIQRMQAPSYRYGDYSALALAISLAFVIAGIVPFLRTISMIVNERERRVAESLESIGMGRFANLASIFTFQFVVQLIIGLIFCGILKGGVLKDVNYFVVLLCYVFFILTIMSLAVFISSFFGSTKRALITGILFYIFMMIFWLIKDSIKLESEGAAIGIAVSPLGNLSLLVDIWIHKQSYFSPYNFSDLSALIMFFRGSTFLIICSITVGVFLTLGIYLTFVFPTGFGIPRHPLFFLGYPRSKRTEFAPIQSQSPAVDPAMIEPPSQELLAQSSQSKTIRIEAVSKKYGNGKLAVDSLSLEMFSDQIFVLLGHNGAGKTTLVSMIAGSFPQSGGKISVLGLDSLADRPQIQKIMGVCPQINPILPYLTVTEHLTLYAKIKGIEDCKEEVEQLLRDIDLFHKRDSFCDKLSGGQKRKLCIALAFVGGSKVIILDEPTSGMDTYARRFMWDMLKKYKKDRVIILTTHNMDEAEYLGDRIAIMSQGVLSILGTSMFLKRKFDVGYVLTAVKTRELPGHEGLVLSALNQHVGGAAYLSTSGRELRFRLPFEESGKFAGLFADLEERGTELCISDIGISVTTLEDVFLQATEKDDEKISLPQKPREAKASTPAVGGLEEIRVGPRQMFWIRLKGMLVKKLLYTRRDLSGLLAEVVVPVLIMIVGFGLLKIDFTKPSKTGLLSVSTFPQSRIFLNDFSLNVGGRVLDSASVAGRLGLGVERLGQLTSSEFDSEVFARRGDDVYYGLFFESGDSGLGFTAFLNSTAPNAGVVAVAVASDALIGLLVPGGGIVTRLSGFQNTLGTESIDELIDGIIIALFFSIAFTFVASSLISGIVKEKESGFKAQQLVSGAGLTIFWLGHLLIDLAKVLLVSIAMYILIFIFRAELLYTGDRWVMCALLLIVFSWDLVWSVYVAAFAFDKPFNAQIFMFLLSFVASYFLVVVVFALKVIESSRDAGHNIVQNIFRVIPQFAFPNGILNLANINVFQLFYGWGKVSTSFDYRISLIDLLLLIAHGLILPAIVIIIENRTRILRPRRAKAEQARSEDSINLEEVYIADEVQQKSDKPVVSLDNVKKSYSGGCRRKPVRAVKGVSLDVAQGEVLGLLGTNGAGKSSTFKMLTGEIRASSGQVKIMQHDIPREIEEVRHLLGFCPQTDSLAEKLSVREHLQLFARLRGINPKLHQQLIDESIDKLNLAINEDRLAGTFSGGNKRKLCVAIALIGKPSIVFLDEPSSGMDPQSRRFMWNVVSDLAVRKGLSTVIITTHSMEEAEALTTRIAIMVEGRLKTVGSNQQIKQKFGQGIEIQIKLLPLFELNLPQLKATIAGRLGNYPEKTSLTALPALLESLDTSDLAAEFAESRKGAKIFSFLQSGQINTNSIVEWIVYHRAARKVETTLRESFNLSVIEEFAGYLKLEVTGESKLSRIFGIVEQKKTELSIEDYSVRQMSLEQIFIKFAMKNVHDD